MRNPNVAAEITYGSQPGAGREAFTKISATIRIYNVYTNTTYREDAFTDSPDHAKALEDFATDTAEKWLKEIVFFLEAVPEPKIIYYKPLVLPDKGGAI